MVIYKYRIEVGENKCLSYQNSKVLSVGLDPAGDICVWVTVDPSSGPKQLRFMCIGTGWEIPAIKPITFIGTVKQDIYMWHVFQIMEEEDYNYASER